MQSFKIDDVFTIVCDSLKTRNGFKHTAKLLENGREIDSCKICYINRTWERYEFESVLAKMLDRMKLPEDQKKEILEDGSKNDPAMARLRSVAMVAQLGDIFHAGSKEAANDWKARMLKAGIGEALQMPDDWDTLTEEEKQRRLDGAISSLK